MKKNVLSITIVITLTLAVALLVWAAVPPPPANQTIGVDDTVFGEFAEADCRVCHDSGVPDRHHMLYGQPIADPSVVPDPDSNGDGNPDTNYACLNCHEEDTSTGIVVMQVIRDCVVCHTSSPHHKTAEAQSGDCVHCHGDLVDNPTGCKELMCAVASSSAGATRGVPLVPCTIDGGDECDTLGLNGSEVNVCVNTTVLCETDADCVGIGTGTCTTSGARCGMYGGEATCDDGHAIPTYAPSLVTPARSGHGHACAETGSCSVSASACTVDEDCLTGHCSITPHASCNVLADCPNPLETCVDGSGSVETCDGTDACSYDTDCAEGTCSTTTSQTCHNNLDCPTGETCDNGVECHQTHEEGLVGGCTFCHSADPNNGTLDPASGVLVRDNHDTHHGAGIHSGHSERCAWCHMAGYPHSVYGEKAEHIRWCENCHGLDSLHNIQVDSDLAPTGDIVVGGENPGWGHIGNDDDCWGCHGFVQAAAPGSGPLTPSIYGADASGMTAGADTVLNLSGTTLTNLIGTFQWTSDISMTAADGSSTTLPPDSVSSSDLAVTIPAATEPGNYDLRAVKGTYAASNPIVISVTPEVVIADSSCNKKKGVLSITGSGFGEKPAGTDAYINAQVNGQSVAVTSWSDTQITASVSRCSNNAAVTVNALMGSATSGSNGGKPVKPCKGKGCNK